MKQIFYSILCGCLVLALGIGPVIAKSRLEVTPGLSEAWREYFTKSTLREPNLDFPYEHCFRRSAAAHNLPVTLLLAVARGESDFNPRAVSHANAIGLMQILWPGTAHHLGINRRSQLYDPCTNVDAGARYLKELLTHYNGDLHRTLAAYNYGPSRVPVKGGNIPKGAQWYSGYIYRHLSYVLGNGTKRENGTTKGDYRDERKLQLIAFGTPYRAMAFIKNLQQSVPTVRLDWFREDVKTFKVVMMYNGQDDLARNKRLLRKAGFTLR